MVRSFFAFALLLCAPLALADHPSQLPYAIDGQQVAPAIYDIEVVARYPHDPTAFTQGLLWHDGYLYESTGRAGQSTIRKVDLRTGAEVERQRIPSDQFGEGLALWQEDLVSLTWTDGVIHRWRLKDLTPVRSDGGFPFQGWGLTTYQNALVASDGTDKLRFLDPLDYSVQKTISATINGRPLTRLNELELVDKMIFANIWMTNFIAGIDPNTGAVRTVIDLQKLPGATSKDRDAVLNGIAWDGDRQRLFVTGKLWPWLYEVRLVKRETK